VPVLIKLSELADAHTKKSCSSAMSNLSSSSTEVDHGTVTALIAMSLTDDDDGAKDGDATKGKSKEQVRTAFTSSVRRVVNVNWMSHLDDINSTVPPPVMMRDLTPPPVDLSTRCKLKTVKVEKMSAGGATEALAPPSPQDGNNQTVPIPAVAASKDGADEVGEVVDRYEKMLLTVGDGTSAETSPSTVVFSNDVSETSWATKT